MSVATLCHALAPLYPITAACGWRSAFRWRIHGLLLSLHFTFPDASKAMRDKALDIILVNAKSAKKPTDAQALAQANLDGGGNTDENRRVKTPLPPTTHQTTGTEIERMQRRVRELEMPSRRC